MKTKQEIQKEIEALQELMKTAPEGKWSPSEGKFSLFSDGVIKRLSSSKVCAKFGMERNKETDSIDLRQKVEWLNFTHAWACECDGVQEFVYERRNFFVEVKMDGKAHATCFLFTHLPSITYMTQRDAEEFARMYNAGLIDFQFQG